MIIPSQEGDELTESQAFILLSLMTPSHTCTDAASAITVLASNMNLVSSYFFQITVRHSEEIESISSSHIPIRKHFTDDTVRMCYICVTLEWTFLSEASGLLHALLYIQIVSTLVLSLDSFRNIWFLWK